MRRVVSLGWHCVVVVEVGVLLHAGHVCESWPPLHV